MKQKKGGGAEIKILCWKKNMMDSSKNRTVESGRGRGGGMGLQDTSCI